MSDEDSTRSTGRGGLAVAGAKLYFILLGLAQQIALPRVLGLEGYGALSRVLSIAIYNSVERLDWGTAHLLSLGMVVFAFVTITATMLIDRRLGRVTG